MDKNKLLMNLVIVALVVSIGGALISMDKLNSLGITGEAIENGTINVTVGIVEDITLIVSNVDFGSMQGDGTNDTTDDSPAPFDVSNEGNICVNITIKRDDLNWFTGTTVAGDTQMNVTCPSNCQSGTWGNASGGSFPEWNNLTTSPQLMIAGLNWTDGATDNAELEIKIHVPIDEPAGAKGTIVTFTASDSGLC